MTTQQTVEIRRLRPQEAEYAVDAVFAGMSPASRRLRFHLPMTRLPGYFRRHLTQLDGQSRVAVVAWADGHPVGIGRLAAVSATEAEAAIAVVDAWHGRGLGRRLLSDLATLASDLGYERLVAEVLAENTAMLRVLDAVFPNARRSRSGLVVRVVCPLPSPVAVDVDALRVSVLEPAC